MTYLLKDLTNGEAITAAFASEEKAIEYAKRQWDKQDSVLAVLQWDEDRDAGKGVALVYMMTVFRPEKRT